MCINTIYIIRTVDCKRYNYTSKHDSLKDIYNYIMDKEYIEAEDWNENNNTVIINTNHIVSIEKWW